MPAQKQSTLAKSDRVLLFAAELARHSPKLDVKEKAELDDLIAKGKRKGRLGWTLPDRTRVALLVGKAFPARLPKKLPSLPRRRPRRDVVGAPDPLDRLVKLADLLDADVVTVGQFETERATLLADEGVARGDGRDPFDRLSVLKSLLDRGAITRDQFERARSRILG